MEHLITQGIGIGVVARYEQKASRPNEKKFIFSYEVTIENLGETVVQLIDRHWIIKDADQVSREVKGPGVIGLQPVLKPGEQHVYNSWSILRTPIGKMSGSYGMIEKFNNRPFKVNIPQFKLIANFVNN